MNNDKMAGTNAGVWEGLLIAPIRLVSSMQNDPFKEGNAA
jgi:hypothetical protein